MNRNDKTKNKANYTITEIATLTVAISLLGAAAALTFEPTPVFAGNGAGGVGADGFQLNLISVPKENHLPNDGNSGHRIFISDDKKSKIFLTEGDFAVLDADGTDSNGARFSLPAPNTNCESTGKPPYEEVCSGDYTVSIRILGNPHSGTDNFEIVSCEQDPDGQNKECSLDIVSVESSNGKGKSAKFTNVSRQLLTVCIDDDDDGSCDRRIDIFSDAAKEYLWETDANGNKLAQLRFTQNA